MNPRHRHEENAEAPADEQVQEEIASKAGDGRIRRIGRPKDVPSLALIKESTKRSYQATYKDIFAPGALDRKTKELIAIASASITGCQGCLIGHLKKAKALGASIDEIKEAVAVAFSVNAATVVDNTDVVSAIMNLQDK